MALGEKRIRGESNSKFNAKFHAIFKQESKLVLIVQKLQKWWWCQYAGYILLRSKTKTTFKCGKHKKQ
jgi:hypothetical protein